MLRRSVQASAQSMEKPDRSLSKTVTYCCQVNCGVACPSMSLMYPRGTPDLYARLAKVCRNEWNVGHALPSESSRLGRSMAALRTAGLRYRRASPASSQYPPARHLALGDARLAAARRPTRYPARLPPGPVCSDGRR